MNMICHISSDNHGDGAARRSGPVRLRAITLDVARTSDDAAGFFSALGLRARDDDGLMWAIPDESRPCITIAPAARKRLRRLGFECPAGEIEALRARAIVAGVATDGVADGEGCVLHGPDGIEIELIAGDAVSGQASHAGQALLLAHAPLRSEAPAAEPLALSHAAIFVTDVDVALAFYVEVVGLRLSDRCGSRLAFLHSPHGGEHHILALVRSDGPGLHHYSFEMGTIDAIGLRAAHMGESGYRQGWGMGRHVLGSNFFHYVRDPWGSHAELTAGLDVIAADADHVAGDHADHDAFYLWGPPPPPGFVDNPELTNRARRVAA